MFIFCFYIHKIQCSYGAYFCVKKTTVMYALLGFGSDLRVTKFKTTLFTGFKICNLSLLS